MKIQIQNKKKTCVAVLLIVIIGIVAYSNSFDCSFHFDDNQTIVENTGIRDLQASLRKAFSGTRGFADLTFALNYHFGKLNVWGYHFVNIIIHIINALLVYFILILTFKTPALKDKPITEYRAFVAAFAAIIFVVHPIQTQAVTYIVQRYASLAALFYLAAIFLYIKARLLINGGADKQEDKRFSLPHIAFYAGALVSAFCAMHVKEITITLPAVILLYEFFFFRPSFMTIKRRFFYLLPFLLTVFIIPMTLYSGGVSFDDVGNFIERSTAETHLISRADYLFTQFNVIVTYIRLLLLPVNQTPAYSYSISSSLFDGHTFFSFLFLAALFSFGMWLFKRSRLASFGIFWFFVTLSVESSIIPIKDVIFEHRVYLPSVGFIIMFFALLVEIAGRFKVRKVMLLAFVLLLVMAGTGLTIHRNSIWKNDYTLWKDAVAKSPYSARAHNALGDAYFRRGQYKLALKEIEMAITLEQNFAPAYYNLGPVLEKLGDIEYAIKAYTSALKFDINKDKAYYNLGRLYYSQKAYGLSLEAYNNLIHIRPDLDDSSVFNSIGNVYKETGDYKKAEENYKKAVTIDPAYSDARYNLADLYHMSGEHDLAIKEFKKVIKIDPDHTVTYLNLGWEYALKGELDHAIECYKSVTVLEPDHKKAHHLLGKLYYQKKEYGLAVQELRKALNGNSNFEIHVLLGQAYREMKAYDLAVEAFKKALEIKPEFAAGHYLLAKTYHKLKKYDLAISEYEEAVKLKPDNADACRNLGVIYLYIFKDEPAALFYLKKSLAANPEQPQANEIKRVVRQLE